MIALHRTNGTHAVPAEAGAGHVRLHLTAAVYRVLHSLRRFGSEAFDGVLERHSFLNAYLAQMLDEMPEGVSWDGGVGWWQDRIERYETASDARLPLQALRTEAGLPTESVAAFVVAGLVEEDVRFGTLFADLQAPLTHRRPCLELLGRLAGGDGDPWAVVRPLLDAGLAVPTDATAPRAEWALRVPSALWDAARAEPVHAPGLTVRSHADLPSVDDLVLPEAFAERVRRVPALLREGQARSVVVRGPFGSDRAEVLGAVAHALGLGVVEVQTGETETVPLAPLCTLAGAMPVLTHDLGPGETVTAPETRGYRGPWGFALGREGAVRGHAADTAVTLTIPSLDADDRRRCWASALGDHEAENLDALADRFHLPGGTIRRAAQTAGLQAALDGREAVTTDDARTACRTLNRQHLDALAEHLDADGSWSHLVVPPACGRQLHELEQRCRHRESLLGHLGRAFGASTSRGVRALFAGPSGTGKTLAARILAAELGMDLYRIDLAAVVNKYVGETEKNLHRVLSVAEALDVVLLLDEGDALMGARTDVKSANDRYANLETNYLLQRLEHYEGIVIVTTNLGDLTLRTASGRERSVDPDAVAPYEVSEAEARAWLEGQLRNVVDGARSGILGFVGRLREKTAAMREERRRAVEDFMSQTRAAGDSDPTS